MPSRAPDHFTPGHNSLPARVQQSFPGAALQHRLHTTPHASHAPHMQARLPAAKPSNLCRTAPRVAHERSGAAGRRRSAQACRP